MDAMAPAMQFWNSSLRGPSGAACVAANAAEPARCVTLPYLHAYSTLPTFHVQSLYDPANLEYCFALPCAFPASCGNAEKAAVEDFRARMQASIESAEAPFGDRDGHFLSACVQHELSCRSSDWFGIAVGSATMNTTFSAWYADGGGDPHARVIDGIYPSNGSCKDINHGAC
jgi:hypothetical protein